MGTNSNILKELDGYVAKKLLAKAESADGKLVQYNYTPLCNNTRSWDKITLYNRGTVYEKDTGKIVAQSMPKFFNYEQLPQNLQDWCLAHAKNAVITKKYDGCLGLIYRYGKQIRCNSRGSFDNFVTQAMNRIIKKYDTATFFDDIFYIYTLVVEVISPETKIIVDYGNTEEFRLITAYERNNEKKEADRQTLEQLSALTGIPLCETVYNDLQYVFDKQKTIKAGQEEGYVVIFYDNGTPVRVKFKGEDYLKVAALRTKLNKHTLWKLLKNNLRTKADELVKEYIAGVPDELADVAAKYMQELYADIEKFKRQVTEFSKTVQDKSDKELGLMYKTASKTEQRLIKAVFTLRKNRPLEPLLIAWAEPSAQTSVADITNLPN